MKSNRMGFTLIELLVVIAIIGILAAILFPVFVTAKDKGRQAACINNQKQIGAATLLYLADWAETFPIISSKIAYGVNWAPPGDPYGVFYPLAKYLKNQGVLKCPSAVPANTVYGTTTYNGHISYLVNGYPSASFPALWGALWHTDNRLRPPARASEIVSPTRVIATQDHRISIYCGDVIAGFNRWYVLPGIHIGGMTFSFADGHAAWVKTTGVGFFEHLQNSDWVVTYPDRRISWSKNYR